MIGEKIKEKRKELGLTLAELAGKSLINAKIIYYIETGRTKRPRLSTLKQLSAILKINLNPLDNFVQKIRVDRDLSQEALAELCDLSRSEISRIETGKTRPKSKTIEVILQSVNK